MAPALVLPLVRIAVTRQLEESRPGPESDQVDDIVWSSEGKGEVGRGTEASSPHVSEILPWAVLDADVIWLRFLSQRPTSRTCQVYLQETTWLSNGCPSPQVRVTQHLIGGSLRPTPSHGCAPVKNPLACEGTSGLSISLSNPSKRICP